MAQSLALKATSSGAALLRPGARRPQNCFVEHKVQWRKCRRRVVTLAQSGGGLGDEDVDVAVFRFTLGIPGFEDRLIPRVVGAFGAALLVINHLFGAQPAPEAQVRAEYVVLALAVVSVIVPDIEERLREALPGRGRQRMADQIEGATNGFLLDAQLPDNTKQELAWSSVSLIKNTNSCGVVLVKDGKVVLARGALGSKVVTPKNTAASLQAMTQDLSSFANNQQLVRAVSGTSSSDSSNGVPSDNSSRQTYLSDRSSMAAAQATNWDSLPQGAQSVLVQGLGLDTAKPSFLLLFSERARSLSDKERRWAAAIANKLTSALA